jgi:hypothetical protein
MSANPCAGRSLSKKTFFQQAASRYVVNGRELQESRARSGILRKGRRRCRVARDWSVPPIRGFAGATSSITLLYGDAGTIPFLAWRVQRNGARCARELARSASHYLLSQAESAEHLSCAFRNASTQSDRQKLIDPIQQLNMQVMFFWNRSVAWPSPGNNPISAECSHPRH